MWFEFDAARPLPWRARWRVPGGRKDGAEFASERERAAFAKKWERQRAAEGRSIIAVGARKLARWEEFERIVGRVDPVRVAREWVEWRAEREGSLDLVVAVDRYKAAVAVRRLARDSVGHRDLHLRRLVEAFPGARLGDLSAEALGDWVMGLCTPRSGPTSNTTKEAHRSSVFRFLEHAVAARWVGFNAMAAVPAPSRDVADVVNVLSVADSAKLFAANREALGVGRLALEAFGGLRYSSAARLRAADLKWDSRGIVMPGKEHKSEKRHYLEGWPDCMWAWLEVAPEAGWDLTPRLYLKEKRRMFERAGLKGEGLDDKAMRNVLRHSFPTYHAAAYRNLAETARLMQHQSQQKLYSTYMGIATQADGLAYFETILP